MERILSGAKLNEELEFFKRQIELIATQKVKFPANYVPPLAHRPRKATLADIPVCQPPATREESDEPQGLETIKLSIKSSKPSLLFSLSCPSTSTISALKSLLASAEKTAPPMEQQRWILKGKAMGDDKLLREFAVKDGDVVNLMITKAIVPIAKASDEPEVPELTLTDSTKPSISIAIPAVASTASAATPYDQVISSPELWVETLAMLRKHFGGTEEGEHNAATTFEAWLSASIHHISASDKAMIREKTLSAMGGV